MNPGHVFSHSQVDAFQQCPKKFAYRYVWREQSKRPRGVEAYMGDRVHAVAEKTFHHFAHTQEIASLSTLLGEYRREWRERMPADGLFIARKGASMDSYQQQGERALIRLHSLLGTRINPAEVIGVEVPLHFKVGAYDFVGYVDLLSRSPHPSYDGQLFTIRDWKTGKAKTWAQCNADPQLALYEIGLRQMYPEAKAFDLVHEYLAGGASETTKRSASDLAGLETNTAGVCRTIEEAHAWPANPSPLCGWCDYAEVCPEARPRK